MNGRQTDGHTDWQTWLDGQADKQTGRQTERWMKGWMERGTNGQYRRIEQKQWKGQNESSCQFEGVEDAN